MKCFKYAIGKLVQIYGKHVLMLSTIFLLCSSIKAQGLINKDLLTGEWQFEQVTLEESNQNKPSRLYIYRNLKDVEKLMAYPYFYTVASLMFMGDNLNINTLELSLLDAPFELKNMTGRQVLEITDNRPEDQREQSSIDFDVAIINDKLVLSSRYYYTSEGESKEGVLTTTLIRPIFEQTP